MIKYFLVLLLLLVLSISASPLRATELTDLGEGLSYLRVRSFEESAKGLTAAIRERDFLVLDLRHATAPAESAAAFQAALAGRRVSSAPLFVLIGPSTPAPLVDSLTSATNKIVTLGVKESLPPPQVVVDQPADTDRRAYEALDSGQPLAGLISGKIGKERYDEVALLKEFTSGNSSASATDPAAKPADADNTPSFAKNAGDKPGANPVERPVVSKAEPLTDRVLQRAVQLHRALAAIKPR
jgi:hypothetical protein